MRYVIYSPPYTESSGGVMALYALANLLRAAGAEASIWPSDHPYRWSARPRWWLSRLREGLSAADGARSRGNAPIRDLHRIPVAGRRHLRDAVVVYPEVVAGNPLKAKRVVRWFLNKPGRISGTIDYGPGELYFYFHESFNDPVLNPEPDNRLTIVVVLDEVYRRWNFGERSGRCYILRKGWKRAPPVSELDGPVIDHLSHREIADIFNRSEYCISYDTHTLYSTYAALCGCRSVIVPDPTMSKEECGGSYPLVAYGFDDPAIESDIAAEALRFLKRIEAENGANVARFRARCEQEWGTA